MYPFESVWRSIIDDVQHTHEKKEFIPTKSSQILGRAIWHMPQDKKPSTGLDVGTGTGVHALLMAFKGYKNVIAIDSSERAIECARARAKRLQSLFSAARDADSAKIRFDNVSLDDFTSSESFDLITFNPSAYFDFLGVRFNSPLSEAIYLDDDWRNGEEGEKSLLFRFFKKVVFPHLRVGGSVLCAWFGLEQRVIGIDKASGRLLHPVHLLEDWFQGFRPEGTVPEGEEFYHQTAQIVSDYGLGETFKLNLLQGQQAGLYSRLFSIGDDVTPPQFHFGILHLIRTTPAPALCFRLVK